MKTAVIILADGFEEVEAVTPIDLLRRAGARVVVAGLTSVSVTGARGIKIGCDLTLGQVPDDWDLLILPGGMPGAKTLSESDLVLAAVKSSLARDCWVAAICAAPAWVLGSHGFLKGKDFTGYPGTETLVQEGRYLTDPVVISGRTITSRGVGTAGEFALTLVELLFGTEKRAEIARSVLLG